MKKFCTIILFLLSAVVCEAGEYQPFIQSGKNWHCLHLSQSYMFKDIHPIVEDLGDVDYFIQEEGDTLIEGTLYTRFYDDSFNVTQINFLREEGGRVYRYDPKEQKEHLMYDFSLEVGDKFQMNGYDCEVTSIGSIVFEGHNLKTIDFIATDSMSFTSDEQWIEGLGGFAGPLVNIHGNITGESFLCMQSVTCKNEVIYSGEFDYPFIYGRPFTPSEALAEGDENTADIQVDYDEKNYTLHIYGKLWTSCNPHQYVYCMINNNNEVTLEFENLLPCDESEMAVHAIDLSITRFPGNEGAYTYKRTDGVPDVTSTIPSSGIYDLQGRRLSSKPQKGIYIQGGKKIVNK